VWFRVPAYAAQATIDPGWDLWDAKRVRKTLWPSTEDWPDADERWPEVAISPPEEPR
jgi:hypothetical protein